MGILDICATDVWRRSEGSQARVWEQSGSTLGLGDWQQEVPGVTQAGRMRLFGGLVAKQRQRGVHPEREYMGR